MEPIETRWLVSSMLIIDGLVNLTIWNQFDDYLVRFIEWPRNIVFDHHSMSIGRRETALCSIESIRFSLPKTVIKNTFLYDMRRSEHRKMSEKNVFLKLQWENRLDHNTQ